MDSYALQAEQEMWDAIAEGDRVPGPLKVVKTTKLVDYPGWVVRKYDDGSFDAYEVGTVVVMSPCFTTFGEAIRWVAAG